MKKRTFLEFFKSIDSPFHLYYDTELFGSEWYERIFEHVEDTKENWKNLKKVLEVILGQREPSLSKELINIHYFLIIN